MSYSLASILTVLKANYSYLYANCSGKLRSKPSSLKEYLLKYAYIQAFDNKLVIEPSSEDLKKLKNALFFDFEHYYIKTMIQYTDYLKQTSISKTWNIVTFYYFLFFQITTLCKYTGLSCIYFSPEEIKNIHKKIITDFDPKMFGKGLYLYSVEKNDDHLKLVLYKDTSGVAIHERSWYLFSQCLEKISKNIDKREQDYLIIEQILNLMNKYKSNFPSRIRNLVNYQGFYAIEELQNKIPTILHSNFNRLFTLRPKASDDYSVQIECLIHIGTFLFQLLRELHEDVNLRLKTPHNEIYELQKQFCSTCRYDCDMSTFDNLFQ